MPQRGPTLLRIEHTYPSHFRVNRGGAISSGTPKRKQYRKMFSSPLSPPSISPSSTCACPASALLQAALTTAFAGAVACAPGAPPPATSPLAWSAALAAAEPLFACPLGARVEVTADITTSGTLETLDSLFSAYTRRSLSSSTCPCHVTSCYIIHTRPRELAVVLLLPLINVHAMPPNSLLHVETQIIQHGKIQHWGLPTLGLCSSGNSVIFYFVLQSQRSWCARL